MQVVLCLSLPSLRALTLALTVAVVTAPTPAVQEQIQQRAQEQQQKRQVTERMRPVFGYQEEGSNGKIDQEHRAGR